MNYYQIDRTSEASIIGIKTGTSQVDLNENGIDKNDDLVNFKSHFSGFNEDFWSNQEISLNLNPPLFRGRLKKGAKVTDIMRYGPVYHFLYKIYSEKYINIIKAFNLPDYKTFGFDISGVDEMYFLLFTKAVTLKEICYEKSTVKTGHKIANNIKYHSIKSPQEYIDFNYNFPTGGFEKLAIPKEYYGKDIIQTEVDSLPFYSEKLVDFLLDCGMTGLAVGYSNSIQLEFV